MPAKKPQQIPLYVKLPSTAVDKLQRASQALGVPKKNLVAELVTRYIDVDTLPKSPKRIEPTADRGPMVGAYSFQPYDPPEIMTAAQAGEFLQISEKNVIELADAGKLPGKKLGPVWRFSRDALVAWLATPDKVTK